MFRNDGIIITPDKWDSYSCEWFFLTATFLSRLPIDRFGTELPTERNLETAYLI